MSGVTVGREYLHGLSVDGGFAPILAARAAATNFDTVFRYIAATYRVGAGFWVK